ncbi:Uncharacterized protein HZ326_16960 [Fusarium oxysporum f. sp. albedinis]|nr:Uncharacterized protein HZ326_16960 [Fusarium oxysporum f. sp. albedinis]
MSAIVRRFTLIDQKISLLIGLAGWRHSQSSRAPTVVVGQSRGLFFRGVKAWPGTGRGRRDGTWTLAAASGCAVRQEYPTPLLMGGRCWRGSESGGGARDTGTAQDKTSKTRQDLLLVTG